MTPVIALEQVLVATDFSEASQMAFAYGRELARRFGASLRVIHVVEDVSDRLSANLADWQVDLKKWQSESVALAQQQLDALLTDEDRQVLRAEAVAKLAKSPWRAIVEDARDHRASLIVAGTHGRGGLAHFVMGSVAERLVRFAPCPVLTVHHPEREFVLPDALQVVSVG